MSGTKVVLAELVEVNKTTLFGGLETIDHVKIKASLLASALLLASSSATLPMRTFCGTPGFATGGTLQELAINPQSVEFPLPPQPASNAAVNPKQTNIFIFKNFRSTAHKLVKAYKSIADDRLILEI
jgi:hypothetical protein